MRWTGCRPARDRWRPRRPRTADRRVCDARQRALAELEPDQKLLLLLYYEQGLTLDEMVGVLGASKATLSRRLDRLRRSLRDVD